jgi:hypothetical protein
MRPTLGRPAFLFAGSYAAEFSTRSFDAAPDGQRFLMIEVPPESAPRGVDLVLNWFEELRKAGQ